jgi:hypothetical protein
MAERVSGRRVSPTLLAACLAKEQQQLGDEGGSTSARGGRCSYADASLPAPKPAGETAAAAAERSSGPLYHSEITISWRPAEHSATAAKLETGLYRVIYHGDAMHASREVVPFNGTSSSFRLVVESDDDSHGSK